jgi:hypothetical protein
MLEPRVPDDIVSRVAKARFIIAAQRYNRAHAVSACNFEGCFAQ